MRTGTSMRVHMARSPVVSTGTRCFICHKRIKLYGGENLKKRYWEGNWYCRSCYLQVSNGIKLKPSTTSSWYTKSCKICGKRIGKIYEYCYEHRSEAVKNDNRNYKREKIRVLKPKRDTTFGSDGNLRKDLGFCQNINCPDRKPIPRSEMIRIKRDSRNSSFPVMHFCCQECMDEFTSKDLSMIFVKMPKIKGKI